MRGVKASAFRRVGGWGGVEGASVSDARGGDAELDVAADGALDQRIELGIVELFPPGGQVRWVARDSWGLLAERLGDGGGEGQTTKGDGLSYEKSGEAGHF